MKSVDPPEPLAELETFEPVLPVGEMASVLFDVEELNGSSRSYGDTFFSVMMGTLIKAVSDYVRYKDSRSPRLKEQAKMAEIWLFAETDPLKDDVLGSFQWVCMVMDRDPSKPRDRIRQMTVDDLPKVDRRKDQ